MSKHKGKRNYEKEIEDAYNRMKKYKEYLRSAKSSDSWLNFLISIGVYPDSAMSEKGSAFWEKVRQKVLSEEPITVFTPFTEREIIMAEATFNLRKTPTGKYIPFYKDIHTGRFISPKKIAELW